MRLNMAPLFRKAAEQLKTQLKDNTSTPAASVAPATAKGPFRRAVIKAAQKMRNSK